ncbi:hypothetical protein C1645_808896 [Glomus cerebriforme]|uniref:Zinc-ribbon domain-containing protein n=1 Tax=Glomus cerebriforme TaxID=658196 RepID=A0A397SJ58_9GLOM|nr:hypothetical protein C1645_808896 [Glomus cerebriforme]
MSSSSCSLNTRFKRTLDIMDLFEISPPALRLRSHIAEKVNASLKDISIVRCQCFRNVLRIIYATLTSVKNEKTWCPWYVVENHHTRTIEDMRKFAKKKGGLCLATEYINRWDPLEWQCKEANNIAQERGGKCLYTEYVNTNTPMLWKCAKGHEWSTTLYQIKNMGRWCTQCAGNLPCGLLEAKEIAHSRGGMCLSTEYINLCVLMQWMCSKGHKWFANFNSIKHVKTWCPYCLNKHKNLCREVITNILGPPSSIRQPDFLKTSKHSQGLELDIYYPQGKQHEQHVKYFHKDLEEFKKQLMRDQIKKELCEENGIALRYVWYYDDPYVVIPNHLRELGLIG